MINFRFHLVSLVAVFLALALGILMGATVIDRAIVDGLESRIDRVEAKADAQSDQNVLLRRQVGDLEDYADEALLHLIERRLEGVSLAVVAVRGIDDDPVSDTIRTMRAAGATVPGVLWLEPALGVSDPETEAKLAAAVTDVINQGDDLRRATAEAVGRRLALGPGASPLVLQRDLLVALGAAGFLAWDALGGPATDLAGYPRDGSRMLVIDGNEGKLKTDAATVPLVRAAAMAGASVALAEVFRRTETGPRPTRGAVVQAVRTDQELAARVATVDDVDEVPGQAALAFALQELGQGQAGHYGLGPRASRQLPLAEVIKPGASASQAPRS